MPTIHDMQQRSQAWFNIRLGLVTGSCADRMVTPKTLKISTGVKLYSAKLAGEKFSGIPDDWDGNNITSHGIEAEDQATLDYQMETGNIVELVGFVTDGETNETSTCGCSPDGHVDEEGMIEIKAQFTQGHVADIVESADNDGACPIDYRLQIQTQLKITERKWCDLVLYHPHLPLKIIRVLPDPDIHTLLDEAIALTIEKRNAALEILRSMRPGQKPHVDEFE